MVDATNGDSVDEFGGFKQGSSSSSSTESESETGEEDATMENDCAEEDQGTQ